MKKFLKKYLYLLIVLIVLLSLMLYFIFNKDEVKEERNPLEEEIVNVTEKINVIEENKKIKIDIKGAVKNPGVYELDDNTRVIDAINVSGGLTAKADTSSINLSKVLKDEMVIVIYTKDEILKAKEENVKIEYVEIEKECVCPKLPNDACISDISKNDLISINTASLELLTTLEGIGEAKAKLIIEYRKNKKFEEIKEIMNVSGIGESLYEKIKDKITI